MNKCKLLAIAAMSFFVASQAFAQATRTWVSGVGDDANPCSRTAPCKTFAGAISKTAAGGMYIQPTGTGTAVAAINGVALDGNGRGLRAEDGSTVVVRNSHAAGNFANGFVALATSRAVDLTLENVVSAGNGATGIYAGALASIKISNTMVTRNNAGLQAVGGGTITSFGNNRVIDNNINNGPPNTTVPQI